MCTWGRLRMEQELELPWKPASGGAEQAINPGLSLKNVLQYKGYSGTGGLPVLGAGASMGVFGEVM